MQAEYEATKFTTDHDVLPDGGRSLHEQAFDTSKDSKEIQVHPTDPKKSTFIAVTEIFATGVVLGAYLALMTVIFFWLAYETNFFPVHTLSRTQFSYHFTLCRYGILAKIVKEIGRAHV